MGYTDGWNYKPNDNSSQCQCVMNHETLMEGDIPQCSARRSAKSNLFCASCEAEHGRMWRKKHEGEQA